jgi:long-chain-acyl-CoA dehydrogenase
MADTSGSLRTLLEADHETFRKTVRTFVEREVEPHLERWDEQRYIDRSTWKRAGEQGLLGLGVPETLGGGGTEDFRYRVVVMEETARVGAAALTSSMSLQDDIVLPYLLDLGTPEQLRRWVPGSCSGDLIGAIAMTEPGAGSDLKGIRTSAKRDGTSWVLNGSKTFITSGMRADYVIVAAKTPSSRGADGMSLFVVPTGAAGFERGRQLKKVGLHAQDTAELFFNDVRLTDDDLLGEEGQGFAHLMRHLRLERLAIAVSAAASARAALTWTLAYTCDREAFGAPLGALATVQATLAEIATEVEVTESYVDDAVRALLAGSLTAVDAGKAKWWATSVQNSVVDRCLQLHGGYGYMIEYPIARAFVDGRVQSIYGGANEVLKMLIGRSLHKQAMSARQR